MPPDCDLLRQFADQGDEAAFAELVRRQADFVYSVALRVTCNGALAQDVTQAVFTTVARQAGKLRHYENLLGWLHTTTRHLAINTVRGESRRRVREQEATAMQNINATPETNWAEIGPLLDEAVGQLRETDREAVLLRFFKNLSHQEVGTALGLGEDAARKRVDRALEKLREHFARRGVTASSTILTAAISANSVTAAPIGLVANVTTSALAGFGGAATHGAVLAAFLASIMTTKTKAILAVVVVLALAAMLSLELHRATKQPAPGKTAANSTLVTLVSVVANLPKAPTPQMAAPVVAPAPARRSSGSAALEVVSSGTLTLSSSPPNADLSAAIPALAHYLETDDFIHVIPFVMAPAEIQKVLDDKDVASMEEMADMVRAKFYDNTDGNIGAVVQALKAIQGKDPILDETGTKAVYQLDSKGFRDEITFFQKDGLWYLY